MVGIHLSGTHTVYDKREIPFVCQHFLQYRVEFLMFVDTVDRKASQGGSPRTDSCYGKCH